MTVADELLDESPPPAPPGRRPSPKLNPFSWTTPEEPEPIPSPSASPEAPQLEEPAGLSLGEVDELLDEESGPDESSGTSSPASSGSPVQLLSKKAMKETAEQAVIIGSGMAHQFAARTEAQQAVGLYLADQADAENIGHPIAEILHRRGDVVGGKLSPDANNALQAIFGLAGYVAKQVTKVSQVKQLEQASAPVPSPVDV